MTEASDLYGLPLERFVPERAALAKRLRGAGEREEAAQVGKLAKPTVAAWMVNQLVRTQKAGVARLFEAGDALKQAQREIVQGGGGAAALRDASAVKRAALAELVDAARGLLDAQGHGPTQATLARVSATLDAAALEDGARETVAGGCVTRELEHVGLGDSLGAPLVPASAPKRRPATEPARGRRIARGTGAQQQSEEGRRQPSVQARRERAEQARRERAEQAARRQAAQRAARELERAQARHDRAAHAVQDARRRLDDALETLHAAEQKLARAREQAAEQ